MSSKRLASSLLTGLMSNTSEAWKNPIKLVEMCYAISDEFVRQSNRRGEGTGKKRRKR